MKLVSIVLALVGLAVGTLIVGLYGVGKVADAALSIGWDGLGETMGVQLGLYLVLATAWRAACPEIGFADLLLGRMVREAATSCLPFSHLGGIAFGVQATNGGGKHLARAFAANVVDVTFEAAAQIAFIALGLAALVARAPDSRLAWPLMAGLLAMAAGVAGFVWLQRDGSATFTRMTTRLGQLVARQWGHDGDAGGRDGVVRVQDEFERVYASPRRVIAASMLHLAAWFGGAGWTWLAYHLLGVPIAPVDALAIEGVVSGVLTLSFVVPANLGVQEAAYIALGSLFGIPADVSLGLSLIRRAKDLAIGVPVLLVWQAIELRRVARAPATSSSVSSTVGVE